MKKRSNLTTFVVVAAALFGLVLVAMKANPILPSTDPDEQAQSTDHHDDEPKPTVPPKKPVPPPKETGRRIPVAPPSAHPKTASKKPPVSEKDLNPDSIDISADYWKQNKDGQQGVAAMDKRMAEARAKQKEEIEKINKEQKEKQKDAPPAKTNP